MVVPNVPTQRFHFEANLATVRLGVHMHVVAVQKVISITLHDTQKESCKS